MKRGSLIIAGVLVVVAVGVYAGLWLQSGNRSQVMDEGQQVPAPIAEEAPAPKIPEGQPPLTKEVQQQLAQSKGFSVLISYTNNGFEPSDSSVKPGTTIRFTNNSDASMRVCGDGVFATCKTVEKMGFWEFTFDISGDFKYRDDQNKEHTGVVHVK